MRRFSLLITAFLILNVFTPHPAFSVGEKYELLDTSRSKCHAGKVNNPSDWDKCLVGAEMPSVKFEFISKQITPGAPLKIRLYFNFNLQPLDGWFETSAHNIDAIWYFQKGPEISDVSRLGNVAQANLEIYCPNTSFQPFHKFNIVNFIEGRKADLSPFNSFLASDSKKIPAVTMISNGTYDLETTLPSSCKEVQISLSQGVKQGVLMQDFKYIRPVDKSVASSGIYIARSRQEGTKAAYSFKTSGKAPVLTKPTVKPSPAAKCSATDLKKYKYTKEQFILRNDLIKIAKEIKNIIEMKREKLSSLRGYYVDYTQKDLYDLQQQDKRIEKAEKERAEWEPDLKTLAKKCGFPMTSKTEVSPGS